MTPPRFNVLMVLSDQHNAGLLGCAGHPQARTPNLDEFARQGMRFTRAYTQNPISTPSRVSILSGQYCHNHGYYGLGGPQPARLPSLFHHFRTHGYRTAAYGKLHLPNDPRNWIADAVDEFGDTYETDDGEHARSEFLDGLARDGLRELEDSWHNHARYGAAPIALDAMCSDLPYERTQERWCADRALAFATRDRGRPFFIQVAFQKPHHPLLPQRRFWEQYPVDVALPPTVDQSPEGRPAHFRLHWKELRDRAWEFADPGETWRAGAQRAWRGTLACVSQVDDVFGRILQALNRAGLAENTIVIYGSDHGAYHTIHGLPEKAPGICSDEVCRVPMLWRVPGITPSGRVCDALVENIDYASTLTGLCGLPPMDTADGQDISGLLHGATTAVRDAAVTENVWSRSIVWDRWRLVHYPRNFPNPGDRAGELYDLSDDPGESRNLFNLASSRGLVEEGRGHLLDWLAKTTRCATTLCIPAEGIDLSGFKRFFIAADGRAPRRIQPCERTDARVDYL
jgi:choline-sulfatase/uncharacterized sulfatase